MQKHLRTRSLKDRLVLLDEDDKNSSPSYFQWQEQTIRTKAFQPPRKAPPKPNAIVRLFRRFG